MSNIVNTMAGVIVLHGLFSDNGLPPGERGPAAFVDTRRHHWVDILHQCAAASEGVSGLEDCKGWFTRYRVWGSWNGCRSIVVSADGPKQEHIDCNWGNIKRVAAPPPNWIQANKTNAMKKIREAARTADIVFIWQPSKLFAGGTVWDQAQFVLDAVHGGGALYGFDDDQVHLTKTNHRTAYA